MNQDPTKLRELLKRLVQARTQQQQPTPQQQQSQSLPYSFVGQRLH